MQPQEKQYSPRDKFIGYSVCAVLIVIGVLTFARDSFGMLVGIFLLICVTGLYGIGLLAKIASDPKGQRRPDPLDDD